MAAALVLLATVLGLAGCGDDPPAGGPATASSVATPGTGRLDRLLGGLTDAVTDRDRSAFVGRLSDRDPGFASTAAMIFDNLGRLRPTDFSLRATGRTAELSPRRRTVLGPDSYAAEVQVGWAVPGDRSTAGQTVWMTISPDRTPDGASLWSGVADGPDRPRPTPLWWLEPIRVARDPVATVIGGSDVDTAPWLARAVAAVRAVAGRLYAGTGAGGPAGGWNRRLVLIIPSNEGLLERMLGTGPGEESALAAITWPDGDPVSSAPIRIMINPAAAESELAARIVLTHETVHVATASPVSGAPRWLVEGFADQIAYQTYPQARQAAAADLLTEVSRSGPPHRLPPDQAFLATGTALDRAYAQAWLACRYLVDRYGDDRLLRFYAAVARSGNGAIGPALRSVYGIDLEGLLAGWRDYLRTAAARGRV